MAFSLYRAQEIVEKRARFTLRTSPQHQMKCQAFLHRWNDHCKEIRKASCIVESYVRCFNRFCAYQQKYVDDPTTPVIGAGPLDNLYMTALEARLRGKFIPITYQKPTQLNPDWQQVCQRYLCRLAFLNYGDSFISEMSRLVDEIFFYHNADIFPAVMVRALSDLIPCVQAYTESELPPNDLIDFQSNSSPALGQHPPFTEDLTVIIRALYKSIHSY